ncbi:hypothetical protein VTN77DRAFT_3990 [Rasamsonia byssochlamydoides]|uniref:uncharacterized protein n=1 Tax=Rasamsonia byssochlamydoides TaxID=89139 RepID=UPI00374340B6
MSPVSVDGSEWSGINQYNAGAPKPETPLSPTSGRANLATPPTSGGPPSGSNDGNGGNGGTPNGPPRRPTDPGNPSPPSSVAARSSVGSLADQQSRRYRQMEESLAQHYHALRRFLGNPYQSERASMKTNKARDKLLRLSPTQFHELSTDVYDELVRRQQAAGGPGRPPRPDVPPFLPPREDFHEKRNQARQKLASLQPQRFRDLSTDVFCELERRFPQFAGPDMPPRMGSPAPSLRGGPPRGSGPPNGYRPGSNGYPPNGFPGGPRPSSRGPGGRGYPSGGPPNGRFPPRQQSLGGGSPPIGPNGEPNPENGPLPKSFQSNTIVPNKSTLVEDDDDGAGIEDDYDGRSDAFALDGVLQSRRETTTTLGDRDGDRDKKLLEETQSQVSSLQERIEELEGLLKQKDEEISRLREEQGKSQSGSMDRQEWEELKAELESKVAHVEGLNSSLQSELDQARIDHSNMERDLREQLEAAKGTGGDSELQGRFEELERRHQSLQAELREQQQITEEVRRDAANFLKEMRAMSERSNATWEREEKLSRDVNRLEEEVKEWKSRYIKARTQLRHLRASSGGISNFRPDVGALSKENEFMQPDGLVKDMHVTKFQMSIDELLRTARSGEPGLVLDQMKVVVVAVRHITQDIEASLNNGEELSSVQKKAKNRVSSTANNLITASKNFASSNGLSPVSLLDAAASHLSTAIVELLRLVKIRPTPAEELEETEEDIAPMQSPGYFSVAPSQSRMSKDESVYSAISSPSVRSRSLTNSRRPLSRNGFPNGGMKLSYGMRPQDSELEELKLYLEDQTEGLVQTIQALVASIRAGDEITSIRSHISAISEVVGNVVSSTENALNKPDRNPALRERVAPVVQTLANCRNRLSQAGAEGEDISNPAQLREVTSKLPPIAFEIARETKELVQRIDQLEFDDGDDDFR